ncbi:hypothetical protein [Methylobacterium planeticum]|uniref:Uncharacterized protein n=1 Tax=Methylobacterium planeticum TaxID=2615211 RepID=A0A6N6MG94_9HYPH|nr:hypothetical protein [Methylobacterium planeticum]KAB1069868.1 hypothetical protein F6X51_24425 [Methylobacterium planeticum]
MRFIVEPAAIEDPELPAFHISCALRPGGNGLARYEEINRLICPARPILRAAVLVVDPMRHDSILSPEEPRRLGVGKAAGPSLFGD